MTHLAACDVAARLRISEDSAYRLMRRMPHVRIGRLIRVAPAELDRYLKEITECDSTDAAPRGGSTTSPATARRSAATSFGWYSPSRGAWVFRGEPVEGVVAWMPLPAPWVAL